MREYTSSQSSHRGSDESVPPQMGTDPRLLLLSIVHDFNNLLTPVVTILKSCSGAAPAHPERSPRSMVRSIARFVQRLSPGNFSILRTRGRQGRNRQTQASCLSYSRPCLPASSHQTSDWSWTSSTTFRRPSSIGSSWSVHFSISFSMRATRCPVAATSPLLPQWSFCRQTRQVCQRG